jgi:hypothetical protein
MFLEGDRVLAVALIAVGLTVPIALRAELWRGCLLEKLDRATA